MRTLPASVMLSSLVLGGWLSGAKAQSLDTPPALNPPPGAQAEDAESLSPGTIVRPTVETPGVLFGITVGELYTDNLKLASRGTPKQSGWVTQIQPFVKSAYSSARFSGVFDYMLSGYVYPGNSQYNQLAQNLNANGTLSILPQHFFLDGSARYTSAVVNNQLPSGPGTVFIDGNRTNVAIASLSPYWLQDLGRLGNATLRYTWGRVMYNDRGIPNEDPNLLSGIPDVTSNTVQFSLASPRDQTWGWAVGYFQQRMEPAFGSTMWFGMARLGMSYAVNPTLLLLVDAGKENRFLPDGSVQKLDAPFWDAGFQWSNNRDSLKATIGHRFFGRSFALAWTHRAARLTTNVSYAEQPTDYNQQFLGMGSTPGSGELPPVNVGAQNPSLTERQPYVSKRLSASAVYTMPHSALTVTAYDELRNYFQEQQSDERVANAGLAWQYNLGPLTTLTPSFNWQRYRFQDGQVTNTRYAQLALVHHINPRNFGSIRLRHDSSSVEAPTSGAHGYDVNVVFVQWTHLF